MTAPRQTSLLPWIAGILALLVLFIRAAPNVFNILLFSAILAYVCAPAVDFLERRRVPRSLGTSLVLVGVGIVFVGMLLLLIPVLVAQAAHVSERLPDTLDYVQNIVIPWIESTFKVHVPTNFTDISAQLRSNLQNILGFGGRLLVKTFGSVFGFLSTLLNLLLIPIIGYFMTRDYHLIWPRFEELVPPRYVQRVQELVRDIDRVLAGFVRGQLLIALILGGIKAIGLYIVGIDGALFIGLLAGLLNFIPFLGSVVAIALALLMAVLKFGGWWPIIGVGIVFGVAQIIEQIVTPVIVGRSVGLSPVAVILSVLAGGEMFGFTGVLLGVPAAAVIKVLLDVVRQAYWRSDSFGAAPALPPATPPPPAGPGPEPGSV